MTKVPTVTFTELAARYCERQKQTPERLKQVLEAQQEVFTPDGWMLLECQMMDSSRMGSYFILPYGPNNTFKHSR